VRRWARTPLLAALSLVLAAAVASGSSAAPDVKDKPAARAPALARLEQVAATVNTLSGDFVQEKHLAVFREVMTSKGRFYLQKPDRLRWELLTPVRSGFVIRGSKGRRWNDLTGRTEAFSADKDPILKIVADQLFSWASADFGRLEKQYRISVLEDRPVLLRLEPRGEAMGSYLEYLVIQFAADDRHVKSVEVHEKGGDFTGIRFVNTQVNGPLAADLF
jgi:outer membrane lipoprotein-sorting protein